MASTEQANATTAIGGGFLLHDCGSDSIQTPERLPQEARLMAKTMEDFVRKEVLPVNDRLQQHEPGLMASILRKAGEIGLLGGSVPESFGGLGLPKSANTSISEKAAVELSFAISIGIQSGMSLLPLLCFGNREQHERYLPRLASGEMIGAFALSEANSGSDALGAQAKASLSPDGKSYLLNGSKMWITNGGFADLYTVFAQVDDDKFTAFLVERDTPGLDVEREEHKMGLNGSSTCRILLRDAPVPVENVLGEVGKGYRPALFSLNLGRFNIGATAMGSAKESLRIAARYASERKQFGKSVSEFGLVKQKLAAIAARTFALESAIYRTAGLLDSGAGDVAAATTAASEEFAIECSIVKYLGTEIMGFAVDEAVQIHGGYGFSEEFPIARAYRDARVFRIFEGTNEINRLTICSQLARRASKRRLAVLDAAYDVAARPGSSSNVGESGLDLANRLRRAVLYCLGTTWRALGERVAEEQEVAASIADACATLYLLDSAALRAESLTGKGQAHDLAVAAVQAYATESFAAVERAATTVVGSIFDGDELAQHARTVRDLCAPPLVDVVAIHKKLAAAVTERGGFPW